MGNEYDLVKFNKVSADIAEIKSAGDFLPDCSTKEGYEASKRFCLDYTVKARGRLTDAHKNTKAPFLKTCRFLDEKKAELMETLRSIEIPHMTAYKSYDEDKAKAREEFESSIMDKIQKIIDYGKEAIGKKSEEVKLLIERVGEINTNDGFHHFKDRAVLHKEETLRILNERLVNIAIYELECKKRKEESELADKKRKEENKKQMENDYEMAILINEKFDRDKKDEDETKSAEIEKARIAAEEQARKNEEEAAERGRQQEIDRHEKERARLEKEEKLRAEDEVHHRAVDQFASAALMRHCGLTEPQACKVVETIGLDVIPNVTIKY